MHTPKKPKLLITPVLRFLVLWVVLFILTGCQGAQKLRDAQNAFNEGARLENELMFKSAFKQYGLNVNDQNVIGAPSVGRPEPHYAAALEILQSIGDAGNAELEKDRLLGTKITLEALCQWKLGRGTQAISLAETALDHLDAENEPRDWVIAQALPALVISDEAYARIPNVFTGKDQSKFDDIENRLLTADRSAKTYIDKATGRAKDRPIEIWLLQVELSLYSSWLKARSNILGERELPEKEKGLLIGKCERLETIGKRYAHEDQKKAAKELADGWRETIFGTINP
jgi:tetratricopeptide (TPR) repeat protein